MDAIFDWPLAITGPGLVLLLCGFSWSLLWIVRKRILPRLRIQPEDSDFSSGMLQAVMALYGLALALIAVTVWQSYSQVANIVAGEAASLGMLYRDVTNYPKPFRGELQQGLRDYIDDVIQVAWPLQHRGKIPTGGVAKLDAFQVNLAAFEPANDAQKILHAESLRGYNQLIRDRRLRLDSVNTHLPAPMWLVIVFGAAISLSLACFFRVQDGRLHLLMVLHLAAFIGVIIFLIVALDRPFRGDLGLTSEPYQLIRDQLMSR